MEKGQKKRENAIDIVMALVAGLLLWLGRIIYQEHTVRVIGENLVWSIVALVLIWCTLLFLLAAFRRAGAWLRVRSGSDMGSVTGPGLMERNREESRENESDPEYALESESERFGRFGGDGLGKCVGKLTMLWSRKWSILVAGVLLWLSYMPCYISYFPGIFAYDATPQTREALGLDALSNFHPVIHTLLWKLLMKFGFLAGTNTAALALYSLLQLTFVVMVYCVMLRFLKSKGVKGLGLTLCTVVWMVVPMYAIFSLEFAKDVYCGGFLVLFGISLEYLGDSERIGRKGNMESTGNIISLMRKFGFQEGRGKVTRAMVLPVVLGVMCGLLRNNVVYALLVLTVFVTILQMWGWQKSRKGQKNQNWCTVCVLVCSVVITVSVTGILYPALGVKGTNSGEALCVPASQLANVYVSEQQVLGSTEKEQILAYVPNAELYNLRFADPVKNTFDNALYREDKGAFWRFYLSMAVKYPVDYIDGFLNLHVCYWYLPSECPDSMAGREYIESGMDEIPEYHVKRMGYLEGVYQYYQSVADYSNGVFQGTILKVLFSIAFPFWALYLCIWKLLVDKRRDGWYLCGLLGLFFLTFFLGPVSNFRYIYGVVLALPGIMALAFRSNPKSL